MRRARNYTGAFRAPLKITRDSSGNPLPFHFNAVGVGLAMGVAAFGFLVIAPVVGLGFIWTVVLPVAVYCFYNHLSNLGHSPFTLLRGTFIGQWAWLNMFLDERRKSKLPKGTTRMGPSVTPPKFKDQLRYSALTPRERVDQCDGFVFGSPLKECSFCGRPSWDHKKASK